MDDVSCAFSFLLRFLFQVSRSANDTRAASRQNFITKCDISFRTAATCARPTQQHTMQRVSIIPVRRHEKLYIFNLCLSEYGNNTLSPFNLGRHRREFFCVAAALNFPVCVQAQAMRDRRQSITGQNNNK